MEKNSQRAENDLMAARETMLNALALVAVRQLEVRGLPAEDWLADQVGAATLATPGDRLPLKIGLKAWDWLSNASDSDAVGVEVARRIQLSNLHLLGIAAATAPNLVSALQVFCRYFPYFCNQPYLIDEVRDGHLTIRWFDQNNSSPKALRDFIITSLVGLLSLGIQSSRPLSVSLSGPPWARFSDQDLHRIFAAPVHFHAPQSKVVFPFPDLLAPLYGSNPTLHTTATQRMIGFDRSLASCSSQIIGALEHLLDNGETRLKAVSSLLGCGERTIQKRLAAEGYTYSELLRRVRKRRAQKLLSETEMPVSSIAFALGYDDISSFSRAYQSWFQQSPIKFREQSTTI
jgi:AraC-like DNA-binding protein